MRRQVRANEEKVFENENIKDTRGCIEISYNMRAYVDHYLENVF